MVVLSAVVLVCEYSSYKNVFLTPCDRTFPEMVVANKSVHKKPLFVIVMYLYPAKYFIKVELE